MAKSEKENRNIFSVLLVLVLTIVGLAFLPNYITEKRFTLSDLPSMWNNMPEEYDMDKHFIYAVIYAESRFDPNAVSHLGASGLMQLMPDTFDWIKYRMKDQRELSYQENVFDSEINIQYGTYMLSLLLEEFGDRDVAVMAYHAGRSNVQKWLDNSKYSDDGKTIHTIPYEDTQKYVNSINKAYKIYAKLYKN